MGFKCFGKRPKSQQTKTNNPAHNLGTGQPYSVLDLVAAFLKTSGKAVRYEVTGRGPDDVAVCYADPSLAMMALGWQAKLGIDDMCTDAWRWQQMNPNGYR